MSTVLVVVTVPQKEYEKSLKERELLCKTLNEKNVIGIKNNVGKNEYNDKTLDTINELLNEQNYGISNQSKTSDLKEKEIPLERVLDDALSFLGIFDSFWVSTKNKNFHQVFFHCETYESDFVIQHLSTLGIGSKYGTSIGILPYSYFSQEEDPYELKNIDNDQNVNEKLDLKRELSGFKAAQSKFLRSITARLTVAQVVDNVRSDASLTFDFVCYLIFGSWIAAMGLMENSIVSLVASMLVSPMMGPVLAITFGAIIKDRSLRAMGFRNLGVCFAICILFGFFFGMITFNFTKQWAEQNWPTNEMYARGLPRVTWVGTLVALPSGAAVAISLLSGNQASLVGVAISVSLLPPAVNAGLLWGFSTIKSLYAIGEASVTTFNPNLNRTHFLPPSLTPQQTYIPFYHDNLAIDSAVLGVLSLCLSIVNVTGIIVAAYILLKIKEIVPLSSMSPSTGRFFQEDIKIVRDYNDAKGRKKSEMGREVLQEWANIAGIDPNELLSDKPEAKVTQLQTLTDIARDVEQDEVYRSVARNTLTPGGNSDLVRRLSQAIQPNYSSVQFRRNSVKSSVTPPVIMSDVESSMIASRRKRNTSTSNTSPRTSRRSSRVSQILTNFLPGLNRNYYDESSSGFAAQDTLQLPPSPTLQQAQSAGITTSRVFTFGNDLPLTDLRHPSSEKPKRRQSALRQSLQSSDHLPYSVWPSATRRPSTISARFTVTPVNESTMPTISLQRDDYYQSSENNYNC